MLHTPEDKKIFCDECGERLHRWIYFVDGKQLCQACVKENHREKVK